MELDGPPVMCTSVIRKQTQLLFLDEVFHLTLGTVEVIVLGFRTALQIGHYETRIWPLEQPSRLAIMRHSALQNYAA